MSKRTCSRCGGGKDFYALVCRACKKPEEWAKNNLGKRGSEHAAWKGGIRYDKDGYMKRYDPSHPWPRSGGYVREHVRLMELSLGRRLKNEECVHHIDGDISNNALSNLELLTKSEHSSFHRERDAHWKERDELGRFTTVKSNV